MAFTVRGKGKAGLNIVGSEVGKILEDLGNGHSAAEIIPRHTEWLYGVPRMQGLPLRMRGST